MIRVLLVDDEPKFLELEKIFFERAGNIETDVALTAMEAMNKLQNGSFDAIVSDYDMPEMDGIVFLKAVHSQYPDLPFIIFTGKSREEVVIEALNNGAEFFLQKGLNPRTQFTELIHKIQHAVERKMTENALKQSEDRYSSLVDMSPDMIAIYCQEQILYINSSGLKLLCADTLDDFYSRPFIDYIHLDSRDTFKKQIDSNMQDGQYFEEKFVRLDGMPVDVEVGAVQIKYMGRTTKLVVARDITERKRADKELKIKETAISSSINGITLSDPDGRISYVNQSFLNMWGYEREEEVIGKKESELWDAGSGKPDTAEYFWKKSGWNGEISAKKKSGRIFDVQISATIIRDNDGNPICRMASFLDITEQKILRERESKALAIIEESINRLTLINDEIRNPLTVIIALAEMQEGESAKKILAQAMEIEKLTHRIDQGWLLSSNMREFLIKRE